MNVLIVANHFAVCSARYAADAFTRLGHNVRHIGKPMGRDIWGMQVPQEYVWEPDNLPGEIEAGFVPDVWIVMDSDPVLLDSIAPNPPHKMEIPFIVWGVDNHVRDYRRPHFDHYFFAHRSVSVMEWKFDIFDEEGDYRGRAEYSNMTWLPCAYDPVAFPPSPIPWSEREYDVCMIGVMYPKRWELVAAMRAAGLKVLAGSGLVYEAYRSAYHNSRVALVSSFNGDLPIRLFEGAGMGCAVLCDEIGDVNLLGGQTPLWAYADTGHAVFEARRLQERPEVGAQSVEWARPHTWDARAQVIIDWIEARS